LAYARMVFEDTYLLVHDADGEEWADAVRNKMHENPVVDETSGLV